MQFKTDKKEFEIIAAGTGCYNGITRARFKLVVTKPFQAESLFDAGDIRKQQGVEGVHFYSGSDVAKAVAKLQGVKPRDALFAMPADALQHIKTVSEDTIAKLKQEAQTLKVEKWFWAIGGDSHKFYLTPDIDIEFREDIKKIEKVVESVRRIEDELEPLSKPSNRDTALYAPWGWHEVSNEIIMGIYNRTIAERAKVKAEKDAKKAAIFAKAKETGEKQILRQWSEECNDKNEECDVDNIYEYAMPDGSVKRERHHTW